jgi:DNA-directed RNA polymerase alpha subunit
MATTKKTLRTCPKGHEYYKSTDCPTCPICEAEKKPDEGFLASMGAPARRALEHAGIHTEKELSTWTEKELLKLHGFGKASLPKLRDALKAKGLSFKQD